MAHSPPATSSQTLSGPDRAATAAHQAVSSPLLEDVSVAGAQGVLLNITGGRDLTLHEVNEASNVVMEAAGVDANVIFGAVIDPTLDGEIVITVIATGFGTAASRASQAHGTSTSRDARPAPRVPSFISTPREHLPPVPPMSRAFASADEVSSPVGAPEEDAVELSSEESRRPAGWRNPESTLRRPSRMGGKDNYDVPAFLRKLRG